MSTSDSAPRSPPCHCLTQHLDRHHVHPSSGTCHHVSSDDDLPGTPPCPPRQWDSPGLVTRTLTVTPPCPPPQLDSGRLVVLSTPPCPPPQWDLPPPQLDLAFDEAQALRFGDCGHPHLTLGAMSTSAPRSPESDCRYSRNGSTYSPCLSVHTSWNFDLDSVYPNSDDDLPGTPPCPPRQCDSPRLTWQTLVTRTPPCPPPQWDSQRLVFRTPVVERSPIKLTRSAFDDATQLKSVVERTLRKHSGFTYSGWWIPQIWARLAIRYGIRYRFKVGPPPGWGRHYHYLEDF